VCDVLKDQFDNILHVFGVDLSKNHYGVINPIFVLLSICNGPKALTLTTIFSQVRVLVPFQDALVSFNTALNRRLSF